MFWVRWRRREEARRGEGSRLRGGGERLLSAGTRLVGDGVGEGSVPHLGRAEGDPLHLARVHRAVHHRGDGRDGAAERVPAAEEAVAAVGAEVREDVAVEEGLEEVELGEEALVDGGVPAAGRMGEFGGGEKR